MVCSVQDYRQIGYFYADVWPQETVICLPLAMQCCPTPGSDLFSTAKRYTDNHLPLLSLADHRQHFLQLYLSFGGLSNLLKVHFCQFKTLAQHSSNNTPLQVCRSFYHM
ncbi:hypothetical protein TNCV_847121 [Trichonephila clavipes]|nr:hypothetical protein TNCV_847121 [Trichonephila clavipes]